MSKRKLTQNQKRRISFNNQKVLNRHLKANKNEVEWQETMLGEAQQGTIIARYSLHADVENEQGEVFRCNLRRTLGSLVVGDKVIWRQGLQQMQGISGVIEAIHPRQSVLSRPDYYDGIKPIAANIDRIIVVSAVLPKLSLNIIDRYLVICENVGIEPIILLNKIDLLTVQQRKEVEQSLQLYRQLGYQVILLSAQTGENMQQLTALLSSGTTIFVGQSGVGKSSLINAIMPEVRAQVGAVSDVSGLGQHTTTVSRLYHLAQGGKLIDSPGIREFGLWHLEVEQITAGYREFQHYLGTCKFRDCKHLDDPGCALVQAVKEGKISQTRFDNYHRLLISRNETKSQRFFVAEQD